MKYASKELIAFTASIEEQISHVRNELNELEAYSDDELCSIIKEVGFECDFCGRCCTREFNDHVFLLDADVPVIRDIDPDALEPAPYPEFCDKFGNFYVSGYALCVKEDGSCVFLNEKRCSIYSKRPSICSLYPYMLHREADEDGNIDWRHVSGLDQHGCYHSETSDVECEDIASDIKEYETAYLRQKLSFYEKVNEHFNKNKLRHVQGVYDREMRKYKKGGEIKVFVFFNGKFEEHTIHN
ncbi:YkgJ family cysteine cluster protein [Methanolobus sp. ZRKC3]|uniref:YkgJ family cysteine cluster protein n=1 Tax=Methanolobus sp. ZRKC3 TaxID=3125786 RepID=UPI00324F3678